VISDRRSSTTRTSGSAWPRSPGCWCRAGSWPSSPPAEGPSTGTRSTAGASTRTRVAGGLRVRRPRPARVRRGGAAVRPRAMTGFDWHDNLMVAGHRPSRNAPPRRPTTPGWRRSSPRGPRCRSRPVARPGRRSPSTSSGGTSPAPTCHGGGQPDEGVVGGHGRGRAHTRGRRGAPVEDPVIAAGRSVYRHRPRRYLLSRA